MIPLGPQLPYSELALTDRPLSAGSAPHGARPSCDGHGQGRSNMVKHYIKYAYSTLTAAMFASMV